MITIDKLWGDMEVEIVLFPMTYLAIIEHYGAPELEHESVNKLIKW